ncbi:hypothetical protein AB0I60_32155 [Actinosynnema sp. NPDC050436]|uniref:hypothetical protein n=1 Tax=Actinosynnema sp. NPDC050436 TaxID=3155659 RepID=UPI0033CB840B
MGSDFFFRTEDIRRDEILDYLVETSTDRIAVDILKSRSPVILRGSRGVGKSFLLRVAEVELLNSLRTEGILPVYVTFATATLIKRPTADQFSAWMLAKICNRIVRAALAAGITLPSGSAISAIRGQSTDDQPSRLEAVEQGFESAWRDTNTDVESVKVPGPEVVAEAVADLCEQTGLRRITLLVDEAAHVFIPEQQRQFFTLMRELRSPYLAVKAAVYPGATAFGDFFQPNHDATVVSIDRAIFDQEYAGTMREIVYKQEKDLRRILDSQGDLFDTLAYAATGNPRILLKTLSRSLPLRRKSAQETIRQYYREEIWAEHSGLSERYPGHSKLIDWGRWFMEGTVLPDLYKRNSGRDSQTSTHIWIHRNAPGIVKEALQLLCYSGILQEGVSGIRGTRMAVGTRYMVNLGCQFALDSDPISYGSKVRRSLSIKRVVEFGANHPAFDPIKNLSLQDFDATNNVALEARLRTPSTVLDLTAFQKQKLEELNLTTIGDVLVADESVFKQARYVGKVRTRQMRSAAITAVLEYLSG